MWDVFHSDRLEVERSLTTDAVRAALARGDLRPDDLIRPAGTTPWTRLADLPALTDPRPRAVDAQARPAHRPQPRAEPARAGPRSPTTTTSRNSRIADDDEDGESPGRGRTSPPTRPGPDEPRGPPGR